MTLASSIGLLGFLNSSTSSASEGLESESPDSAEPSTRWLQLNSRRTWMELRAVCVTDAHFTQMLGAKPPSRICFRLSLSTVRAKRRQADCTPTDSSSKCAVVLPSRLM
eukprot:1604045-Pleurochrysis_carterae.AAC.1